MLMFLIIFVSSVVYSEEYKKPEDHIHDYVDEVLTTNHSDKRRWNDFLKTPKHSWSKRDILPKSNWVPQERISAKDLHFLANNRLFLLPYFAPRSAANLTQVLKERSIVTGQIPQKILEECETSTPFPSAALYTTGTYALTSEFLHCTKNIALYPARIGHIRIPLNKNNTKKLHEIIIDRNIDAESIANLIGYKGSVTLLHKKVPPWLLKNIENVQWRILNLPNVSKISTTSIERLVYFPGDTIRLNGLKKLGAREAKRLQTFPINKKNSSYNPYRIEMKGLANLSPKALSHLSKPGFAKLTINLPHATPKHFAALRSRSITFVGLTSISQKMADSIKKFNGRLDFPDLKSIDMDVYLSLLNIHIDDLKQEKSSEWYSARNKKRNILLPTSIIPITKKWVELRRALYWMNRSPNNIYAMLYHWRNDATKADIEGLQAMQIEDKRARRKPSRMQALNGLTQISPEMAQFCIKDAIGMFSLDGLTSIEPQILSMFMDSSIPVSMNGLTNISMEQAQIIASRSSQANPSVVLLKGITRIDDEVLIVLSELDHVVLPDWTLQHHFPKRHLEKTSLRWLENLSPEQFSTINLEKIESLSLVQLPVVTPKHITHIAQYPIKTLTLHAWSLSPETIQRLLQWPHPQTSLRIQVDGAPMQSVQQLALMNIEKIAFHMIQEHTPDLSFLQSTNIDEVDLFFDWMAEPRHLDSLSNFDGKKLIISSKHNASVDDESVLSILQTFQGTHLRIEFEIEVSSKLAKAIMNSQYNLSIRVTDFQEESTEEILSILRDSARRNNQYSLAIEGSIPICGEEYRHIQNEQCDIEEEMRRALEYWEHHDCGEEEHEEHK